MEKELTFSFEGSKYTLAFNRKTVQQLTNRHPDAFQGSVPGSSQND